MQTRLICKYFNLDIREKIAHSLNNEQEKTLQTVAPKL